MEFKYVPTVCPFCGTGCSFNLVIKEGKVVGTAPFQRSPVCEGKTCQKGHFAYELVNSPARLTKPMIKKGDGLVEASWDEAIAAAAKLGLYSGDDVFVVASASATNEDLFVTKKFADEVLKTKNFTTPASVGIDASAGTIAGLAKADCIVAIGNIVESHPLVARRIANAKDNGARVIVVDTFRSPMAKMATEFVKATPGAEAAAVAEAGALVEGKAVAVVYGIGVTFAESTIAAAAKALAESKNAAFCALPAQSNGRGSILAGAATPFCNAYSGKAKAFFVVGEDLGPLNAEFAVVIDSFLTSTAKTADVVFPAAVFAEVDGTVTNAERRIQLVRKAQDAAEGVKANWQIVAEIAAKLGGNIAFDSAEAVFKAAYPDLSYEAIAKDGFILPEKPATVEICDCDECKCDGIANVSDEYPLLLTTSATIWHGYGGIATLSANCKSLMREVSGMFVKMSKEDAKELNILPTDFVKVTTANGSILASVQITKDIDKGVIYVPTTGIGGGCIFMLTKGAKAIAAKIEKAEA